MKLSESRYAVCLREQSVENFPALTPEALAAAYPGRNQAFTQVLSSADARLNRLTEK